MCADTPVHTGSSGVKTVFRARQAFGVPAHGAFCVEPDENFDTDMASRARKFQANAFASRIVRTQRSRARGVLC